MWPVMTVPAKRSPREGLGEGPAGPLGAAAREEGGRGPGPLTTCPRGYPGTREDEPSDLGPQA